MSVEDSSQCHSLNCCRTLSILVVILCLYSFSLSLLATEFVRFWQLYIFLVLQGEFGLLCFADVLIIFRDLRSSLFRPLFKTKNSSFYLHQF